MAGRSPLSLIQYQDSNGDALSGAKMYHYAAGTSTPLDSYSDDALSVANANPVIADTTGRFGDIFFQVADYKVILKDADNQTIFTADPVRAPSPKASTVLSKSATYTVTASDDGKLIAADATGGAFTITLPPAATVGDGFEVSVIKIDPSANVVTIDGDGSETINDNSSLALSAQFDSVVLRSDASEFFATVRPSSTTTPLPRGYIDGLTISLNSVDSDHDIDIAAGACRDSGDESNLALSATLTKRIDAAWAVGDGNGGLDTSTVANDTGYFVYAIRRSDTGVVDALISASSSSPTMPTNYDQKRLIGYLASDGSANIAQVYQLSGPTSGIAQATTTGTAFNYLNIPSWAKKITISFMGVSLSGSDNLLVQIGDGGGLETTNYISSSGVVNASATPVANSTAGFVAQLANAGVILSGAMTLTLVDSTTNTWSAHHSGKISTTSTVQGGGDKSLSAALDRVTVTRSGTDAFDAGKVNILIE